MKPLAPVTVECVTVSSAGNMFQAQCTLTATGQPAPERARPLPIQGAGVTLKEIVPPSGNGIGKWLFTFEFNEHKPVGIPFEVRFQGGTGMTFGAQYDPFASAKKPEAILGVVKKGKDGSRIQEFPSK
ncbi:MAG: hypothetical protein HZA04_08935 [Nitrospinae bacterium]|nr:hypothetical protein [Nitrospinota bacterium]